ncbi:MAG: hypothetical protein GDA56_04505 [Hormoscilla sp. GM7CHS1pb]|nr:hypothetical protein [Hormoscilla sp. GM7CHS1pb]
MPQSDRLIARLRRQQQLDKITPKADRFLTSPISLYIADRRNPRSPLIPIAIQLGQVL